MLSPLLLRNLYDLLCAINFCLEKKLIIPGLLLIYFGIDSMVWLSLPKQSKKLTRTAYINWVNEYMKPENTLQCTGEELYNARCTIMTSIVPETGNKTNLFYAWGNQDKEALQKILDGKEIPAKAIHITELFAALDNGIQRFLHEKQENQHRKKLTNDKFCNYLQNFMVK